MSSLLKALVADGKVPLYLDFRLGTLRDLSGTGNDCVSAGNERWINDRGRLGMLCPAGTNLQVAHHTSLDLSELTVVASVHRRRQDLPITNARLFTKGTTALQYGILFSTGSRYPTFQTSVAFTQSPLASVDGRYENLALTWFGDLTKPTFFGNQTRYGQSLSVGAASSTQPLYIGNYGASAISYHFGGVIFDMAFINEALDDADVVRLMRELDEGPQTVRRPRKSFSFPYPAKTPAQYAADSIVADFGGEPSSGQWPEHVSAGSMSPVSQLDITRSAGGAFLSNASNGRGANSGTISYGGATAFSVELLAVPLDDSTSVLVESGVNVNTVIGTWALYLEPSYRVRFLARSSSSLLAIYAAADSSPLGLPSHILGTFDPSLTGSDRMVIYINGIASGAIGAAVVIPPTALLDQPIYAFSRTFTSFRYDGALGSIRVWNRGLTAAEVRSRYLQWAKRPTTDARVSPDGSSPVALSTTLSVGNVIANGWKIESAVANVTVRDAADGRYVYLPFTAAPYLSHPCSTAYGSWYFETEGNNPRLFFVSQDWSGTASYSIYMLSGSVRLYETGSQIGNALIPSNTGRWRWWICRDFNGRIRVWYSQAGGAWTALFDVTNNTNTSSKMMVVRAPASNLNFYGAKVYAGEMTLTEAIAAGLIQ